MNFKTIAQGIYRVENFCSTEQKFNRIFEYVQELDYIKKTGKGFKYSIVLFSERLNYNIKEEFFDIIKEEIGILEKLFLKVTGKKYILNNMGSFMKLDKSDYIEEHTDTHSDLQCVMYFQNLNEKSGSLNIFLGDKKTEVNISPIKNSIIVFPGKTLHAVPIYNGVVSRYSISFGFSTEERERINSYKFKNEVEEYLKIIL